jgi:hypothetical protein
MLSTCYHALDLPFTPGAPVGKLGTPPPNRRASALGEETPEIDFDRSPHHARLLSSRPFSSRASWLDTALIGPPVRISATGPDAWTADWPVVSARGERQTSEVEGTRQVDPILIPLNCQSTNRRERFLPLLVPKHCPIPRSNCFVLRFLV